MESASNENLKHKHRFNILDFLNNNHSWILGLATIIITVVYGIWGLNLSKQQTKLTRIVFSSTELGDINRLSNKLHQLQREHLFLINFGFKPSFEHLKEYNRRLEKMKNILVSEMDNLYLNNNDTIHKLWIHTYNTVGDFNQQLEFSIMYVGKTSYNPNDKSSDIIQVDIEIVEEINKKFGGKLFTSVGALTGYAFEKVEQEKIKKGLLDKNGKSKVNPMDFYNK